MKTATALNDRVEDILTKNSGVDIDYAADRPTVLIATIDPEICSGLTELFQSFSLNTIWLKSVEAAKNILARKKVAACLCGFWLQDGTYRELVRHVKREKAVIPVIIVSPPACPQEYRDYLAAINIGALDFLCHPYRKSDFETMLRSVIGRQSRSLRQHASIGSPDLRVRQAV